MKYLKRINELIASDTADEISDCLQEFFDKWYVLESKYDESGIVRPTWIISENLNNKGGTHYLFIYCTPEDFEEMYDEVSSMQLIIEDRCKQTIRIWKSPDYVIVLS